MLLRALVGEVATVLSGSRVLDAESRADAAREARLLASGVLGCTPGELATRMDRPVPTIEADRVRAAGARRARGEPLAYCTGNAAFRHLELLVDSRVLIPRPETELVVEEALRVTRDAPGGIAVDVGTGSGAIALSLATEGRFDLVIATDISRDALAVASANAAVLRQRDPSASTVEFRTGADLAPLQGVRARVIVSNPPYIAYSEADALPRAVRDWEPATALFAADGGMARYDRLFAGVLEVIEPGGWLVLEVDATRAGITAERARAAGLEEVTVRPDLSGRERVLSGRAPR